MTRNNTSRTCSRRQILAAGVSMSAATLLPTMPAWGLAPSSLVIPVGTRVTLVEPTGFGAGILIGITVELLSSLAKDALASIGLWPGRGHAPSAPRIVTHHRREVHEFRAKGFDIRPLHEGRPPSSHSPSGINVADLFGDGFEMAEAVNGAPENFRTLHTTAHGPNLCSYRLPPGDVIAMTMVFRALSHCGFSAAEIFCCALPVHAIKPSAFDRHAINHTQPLRAMTGCGGGVTWSCDLARRQPTVEACISDPDGQRRISVVIVHVEGRRWSFTRTG